MPTLNDALALAQRGFHVFPVVHGSKTPLIQEWQNKATTDEATIRQWWTCPITGWEKDHNIGICTSRFNCSDHLVVLDLDKKDGRDGVLELGNLLIDNGPLPTSFRQKTPSGGEHIAFRTQRKIKQGTNVLAPGIDVRAMGGYIVAAPSTLPNGAYQAEGGEVEEAPAWVLDMLQDAGEAPVRSREAEAPVVAVNKTEALRRGLDYLLSEASEATAGDRNNKGFAVACRLKDFGLDRDEILTLMAEEWNCTPPLEHDELEHVVRSAFQYGQIPVGAASPEAEFPRIEQPDNTDDPVTALNNEFAFVLSGGGSHILWETKDHKGQQTLVHLSEQAFHKKFASRQLRFGRQRVQVTEAWMNSPNRRSYDGLVFQPGIDVDRRFYNLWTGFAFDVDAPVTAKGREGLDMYLSHLRENICGGVGYLYDWLIAYLAHLVQKPWEKPHTALVLRGAKGVGKNQFVEHFGKLLGPHFVLTSNRRYLLGQFNGHLESCLLMVLDEAFWSGDKQAEGTIKDLITGSTHIIEHKGKEPYVIDNLTRIVIMGNERWLVPASYDERRFAVFDVGEGKKQNHDFFAQLNECMQGGGYQALLAYLSKVNIHGFNLNCAPYTEALADQKYESLDIVDNWWHDSLMAGHLIGLSASAEEWKEKVTMVDLKYALATYCRGRNIRSRLPDDRSLFQAISRSCPMAKKHGAAVILPALNVSRGLWDRFMGHETQW